MYHRRVPFYTTLTKTERTCTPCSLAVQVSLVNGILAKTFESKPWRIFLLLD